MKRFILVALMLLGIGLMRGNAAEFNASDCPFSSSAYQIDCGFVTVPADHAAPDGETFQLAVAIIRSPNPEKLPDPVLYLEGGPGGATVELAPAIHLRYPFLGAALQNRDVILVDQRGMGLSRPAFYCTPFRSITDAFTSDYMSLFMERMPECLDDFEQAGLDWRLFTTEQNALDLAMVGEALGYEEVNLLGTSYGTLLGLIIMRERPEVVRSAILDSVLIPAASPFESSAADFEASFAQLEAYCAVDFACNLAYPNLRENFIETYERLEANPDSVEVGGRPVPVTAAFFAGRVRYMLASVETARLVPAFITGVANRDYDVVREFIEMVYSAVDMNALPNQALYMTMVCPQSYSDFEGIDSPFQMGGFSPVDSQMCQAWGELLPFDRSMPRNDVPVLLLSGELDPLTPPQWSAIAAEGLSKSQRLLFPNLSHEVLQNQCGQSIALDFLNEPSAAVDTSCISEISNLSFILHTTVTRFPIQVVTALLSLAAVFGMGLMVFYGLRDLRRTAWWASFRRLGYFPLLGLLFMMFLIFTDAKILPPAYVTTGLIQSLVPLMMGLHVAAVFNPADEPSLELQLAAPRSIMWMLAERIFTVVLAYSVVALIGVGLSYWRNPEQDIYVLTLGWLPPALFLSGAGIYLTVRSRLMAMGVMLIGIFWFLFALFAEMFLPGQPFPAPFHLIQPFIWPMHIHATLNDLAPQDFWLNRLFLTVGGIGFMLLSAYSLRDTEELLMGVKARNSSGKKADANPVVRQKSFSFQPVLVKVQPLAQIFGIIRYEFLMRWRTRGMKVFVITPIVLLSLFIFLSNPEDLLLPNLNLDARGAEFIAFVNGKLLGAFLCSILFVPVFYLFPVMVADNVPNDKRFGVEELLNATPLAFTTQMLGRVLGNILAAWSGLLLALIVMGIIWYLRNGAFIIEPLIDLGLGSALFCAVTTAITILLGASQSSSRRAVFLVIAFLFSVEFFQAIEWVRFFFPTRSIFVVSYFRGMEAASGGVVLSHEFNLLQPDLLEVLYMNGLSLLLIWLAVWAWKRWKQA